MTIKELYEWAAKNNLENYDLILNTSTGESDAHYGIEDFIVDERRKEISF